MVAEGNGLSLTAGEKTQQKFMEAIVKEVSKDKDIVLKGGGALIFGYGLDRFSNDLDFDAMQSPTLEDKFKTAAKATNIKIDNIRIRKDTETVKRYKIDCAATDPSGVEDSFTLKVEVSMRNKTIDPQHTNTINGIKVYTIENLISQKLSVFENRSVPRARDLNDVLFLAEKYGSFFSKEQSDKLKSMAKDPDELAFKFGPDYAKEGNRFRPLDDMILGLDIASNKIAHDLAEQPAKMKGDSEQ